MIHEWIEFIRHPDVRTRIVFLSDYDMFLTQRLVQGVDVWINTPRRPWEACGTSGMKVLVNGGINLSELDGWWAEAYSPDLGWAIGDGLEHGEDPGRDSADAEMLYHTIEQQVIPEFYNRNRDGMPTAWVARMRESMARLTPQFSANRAVREYTEQRYLPAASNYSSRIAEKGLVGRQLVESQHQLERLWPTLHFDEVKVETSDGQHAFEVRVFLNDLDPQAVRVELYANNVGNEGPLRQEMRPSPTQPYLSGSHVYVATVSAARPPGDYTARLMPRCDGATIPLEGARILWQR